MVKVVIDFLRSLIAVLIIQAIIILFAKFIVLRNKHKGAKKVLPQPLSLPFIGNLLQLSIRPLDKLNDWSKKYGPIYGINLGQRYFIVLNNHEVVNDLIVKCGSLYSSRYNFHITNPTLIKSNSIALAPYGDKWKRDRSIAYSALTSRPIKSYYNYIYNDTDILIKDLMTRHGGSIYPLQIIKKFVLTNMLNILFGDRSGYDDEFFDDVMKVMDDITDFSSPKSIIKDLLPPINYAYKSNKAESLHRQLEAIFSSKYDRFLRDYAQDKKLSPSFLLQIQDAINEKENSSIEYDDIWEMLVGLLSGAMETEVNTLMWMLACLANNPGVQDEAFYELDDVCKKKPKFEDESDLPYISAIINETLRYRPPNPFGFAHVANKDDDYNGYFIPKDTPLLLNLFAINHNERRFIAPDKFRPSRFLQDYSTGSVKSKSILLPQFDFDSGIESEMANKRHSLKGLLKNNSPSLTNSSMPMHMSFGAGRRYCIGQHLAQKQLFIAIAHILWAFEIKPGDEDINLDGGNLSLTSFSPYPYKVRFILRKDLGLLI